MSERRFPAAKIVHRRPLLLRSVGRLVCKDVRAAGSWGDVESAARESPQGAPFEHRVGCLQDANGHARVRALQPLHELRQEGLRAGACARGTKILRSHVVCCSQGVVL